MKENHKNFLGITLIETLIYSALLVLIIGIAVASLYQIIGSSDKTRDQILKEEEANFVFRKMAWALAGAQTINSPLPGATSSILSVNKANFSANPLIFDLNSGNIRLTRNSGAPAILNSQNFTITNLVFKNIPGTVSIPAAMEINLTINDKSFRTTIYLRI